jgi:hypothetical protein
MGLFEGISTLTPMTSSSRTPSPYPGSLGRAMSAPKPGTRG